MACAALSFRERNFGVFLSKNFLTPAKLRNLHCKETFFVQTVTGCKYSGFSKQVTNNMNLVIVISGKLDYKCMHQISEYKFLL